jgi:uncharacterized protein YjbI with pentapeptide repeats
MSNKNDLEKAKMYSKLMKSGLYDQAKKISLKSANLEDANLKGVDFTGINLADADLENANLEDANLENANLSHTNLISANLNSVYLSSVNLEGANLSGADLRNANLSDADLSGSVLSHANLIGAYLLDANLKGANLRGANLTNANLKGANLRGANLEDANFEGVILIVANLIGANIKDAKHLKIYRDHSDTINNLKSNLLPDMSKGDDLKMTMFNESIYTHMIWIKNKKGYTTLIKIQEKFDIKNGKEERFYFVIIDSGLRTSQEIHQFKTLKLAKEFWLNEKDKYLKAGSVILEESEVDSKIQKYSEF